MRARSSLVREKMPQHGNLPSLVVWVRIHIFEQLGVSSFNLPLSWWYCWVCGKSRRYVLVNLLGILGGSNTFPSEIVMVRLQGDFAKPPEKRFNYKHCFDALFRVSCTFALTHLFPSSFEFFSSLFVFLSFTWNYDVMAIWLDRAVAELLSPYHPQSHASLMMCSGTLLYIDGP